MSVVRVKRILLNMTQTVLTTGGGNEGRGRLGRGQKGSFSSSASSSGNVGGYHGLKCSRHFLTHSLCKMKDNNGVTLVVFINLASMLNS